MESAKAKEEICFLECEQQIPYQIYIVPTGFIVYVVIWYELY